MDTMPEERAAMGVGMTIKISRIEIDFSAINVCFFCVNVATALEVVDGGGRNIYFLYIIYRILFYVKSI